MRFISNVPLSEFDKFEKKHPLGRFMQTREQLKVTGTRKEVGCVGVYKDNQLVAAAYYFVDHTKMGDIYSIKGGPLLDYNDLNILDFFVKECGEYFKRCGALAMRITPPLDYEILTDNGKVKVKKNGGLIDHFKEMGFSYVPQLPITDNHFPVVGLGYEYRKDLRGIKNVKELRATYDRRVRNDIRRAEKFGVYLDKLDYNQLEEFKNNTEVTANHRNYHDRSLSFYQQVYREFGDDVVFIEAKLNLKDLLFNYSKQKNKLKEEIEDIKSKLQQKNSKKLKSRLNQDEKQIKQLNKSIKKAQDERNDNGDIITLSGGMFYIQPQEIAYMFSFTNKQFSNYYGQHYLMDHMMQVALDKGIPTYNFYMVTGNFSEADGVFKFKQLFQGNTFRTIGWFEKSFHPFLSKLDRVVKSLIGHAQVR